VAKCLFDSLPSEGLVDLKTTYEFLVKVQKTTYEFLLKMQKQPILFVDVDYFFS